MKTVTNPEPKRTGYKRVMLKLGGEMFGGGKVGIAPDVVENVARQIAEVAEQGTEIAVVIGGGNFFRGAELSQRGMDRARSDYMGMLGTVMNSLALQDLLKQQGIDHRGAARAGDWCRSSLPGQGCRRRLFRRPAHESGRGALLRDHPARGHREEPQGG